MKKTNILSFTLAAVMTISNVNICFAYNEETDYKNMVISNEQDDYPTLLSKYFMYTFFTVEGGNIYYDPISNSINHADKGVTHVDIPACTNEIYDAFWNCDKLTTVNIPNSVNYIGNNAFWNCSSLTTINIPNDISYIGDNAFWNCSSLTNVIIPNIPNRDITIGDNAFSCCKNLTNIFIPNNVTYIGNNAFSSCHNLTVSCYKNSYAESYMQKNSIPYKIVEEIAYAVDGGNIYYDKDTGTITNADKEITYADIPKSIDGVEITSIGNYAFYDCKNLTNIVIPDSVSNIGNSAFAGCNLTNILIPNSISYISNSAFYNCNFTNIVIPNSISVIGNSAFEGCNITNIDIPNNVTTIGSYAFSNCKELTDISLPNSVTTIGDSAFYRCSNLTTINIPNSVTTIGNSVFVGCGLYNIVIPDSVSYISDSAFWGCDNLTDINIPDNISVIGNDAFSFCDRLTTVNIPNSVTTIGKCAFWCCQNLTNVNIPNSVTTIREGAFGYNNLTNVTIPDNVSFIGDSAFYNCDSLTTINIPDSVTTIGDSAFYNCDSLTVNCYKNSYAESYLQENSIPYKIIEDNAYIVYGGNIYYDQITGTIINADKEITYANIPEFINGVEITNIGDHAFYNCDKLTEVVISNSVSSIGENAFENCSNLTNINIPNNVNNIADNAFIDCNNLTVSCYKNSYAESYLQKHSIPYKIIEEGIRVLDVTINEIEINTGDKFKLKVKIIPENAENKNILWKSSNTEIISIDEYGLITGLREGTSIITATTEDGGFTSEITVFVNKSENTDSSEIIGDINKDGDITALDASLILQKALNKDFSFSNNK